MSVFAVLMALNRCAGWFNAQSAMLLTKSIVDEEIFKIDEVTCLDRVIHWEY